MHEPQFLGDGIMKDKCDDCGAAAVDQCPICNKIVCAECRDAPVGCHDENGVKYDT